MKWLVVGDVHAKENELGDCASLIEFIRTVAIQQKADSVVFMGDQYHNHSLVHLEVMNFWKAVFSSLTGSGIKPICLVGNHDMTGSKGSVATAMMAHEGDCVVVREPTRHKGVLFMPYVPDAGSFVSLCKPHLEDRTDPYDQPIGGCKTIFCHQTFSGSVYDNGFYARDGINPDLLGDVEIVSGHIHTPQSFANVFYVGGPRWLTAADANIHRAIWLIETDPDGCITAKTPFSTGEVCRKTLRVHDREEAPIQLPLDPRHRWYVDVFGSPARVEARVKEISGPGVVVRPIPDSPDDAHRIRESDGIESAFGKFLSGFQGKHGTPMSHIKDMVRSRLGMQL